MRGRSIFALAASALTIAFGAPVNAATRSGADMIHVEPLERRQRQRIPSRATPARYRSRWKAARSKRRSNMLHVSRRTRRKHRRAQRG